ncbi:IclR family transcriptional regulator [Microbacterium sp. CFH 31415]|nr:IclR family transcriptional regulator [Microbacterium sp. CFH 31415]
MAEATRRPGVLERITLIMDCLAEVPGRMLLEEVVETTGLPKSTTHRMLVQLVEHGWVDHAHGGYTLGPRLVHRGASTDLEELRSHASPVLNELASMTASVAHLAVLRGGFVHYIDKIGGGVAATVPSQIGTRIVASEAACGIAMLAWTDRDEIVSMLDHTGAPHAGAHEELFIELAEVRRRGIAHFDGGVRPSGVSSVGAAIRGPAGPVAALSVARRGTLSVRDVGPLVAAAARRIGVTLFGEWQARTPGAE